MRLIPSMLLGTALLTSTAYAGDPLGLYVGAGVGQSQLQQNYYQIDSHVTGWKLLAGWRPLSSFFGLELEYADLGSKDATYVIPGQTTQISTDAHATSLFVMGYLPVPEPWLDLYAKAGAARIQQNTSATTTCSACFLPVGASNPSTQITDNNHTAFAWGAGLQFKFGLPALRLEYERFDGAQGNSSLLSAAVTANF